MTRLLGVLLLAVFSFATARAGDWHAGNQIACSDCHTMHNSQGGQPMRYDGQASPSAMLLRHANTVSLCIYCHDGTHPNVPDVIAPVAYTPDPAGGFFSNSGGTASNTAHDLGMSAVVAPGGSDSLTLTCVSCHDIHGNANYRNLWLNPPGTGNATDVTVVVNQSVQANGSNPAQVYIPSNLRYKSGMSQWCNDCHTNFHGKTAGEEGGRSPWFRHPQEQTISTGTNVDYAYWSGSVPNRVPVQTPNDDVVPSSDDQVFCLSCHKAHGSSRKAATIFADGATLNSTCQQCHNH